MSNDDYRFTARYASARSDVTLLTLLSPGGELFEHIVIVTMYCKSQATSQVKQQVSMFALHLYDYVTMLFGQQAAIACTSLLRVCSSSLLGLGQNRSSG